MFDGGFMDPPGAVTTMPFTFKHGDRPLDDYTIQRAVGSGGFGEVYYALSDGGREVALKYLKSNPQIELRGVSHCINLKSPHLVSIFDVKKSASDEYFVIMEYCSGPSLRDLLIAEPNGFGPQKAAFFTREVAKGLAYLHDRGIVHRDLKPGNIFYDDGYVKIGDYGLSKFISISRHSAQTASIGTVHYMAPEIGSGNYSKGVDIYALGVMLYEMLLGKVPFEGSSMAEVLMKHLTQQPAVDELPEPFGRVIRKALQKDPKDRYQSVDEMVDELLSVDTVRDSVAGFSTMSLEGAVRQGAADAASPMPSPNPPPIPEWARGGGQPAFGNVWNPQGAPLPDRLAKRLEKISRKVEKKVAKLAGRADGVGGMWGTAAKAAGAAHQGNIAALGKDAYRGRRKLLLALMLIGMAIALGVIAGNTHGENYGIAAAMTTVFMYLGLRMSKPVANWFSAGGEPNWAPHLVSLCCCAPLVAAGATPLLADAPRHGLPFFLGLLAMCTLANWDKERDQGESGELSFGLAFWAALSAVIWTNIAAAVTDNSSGNTMMLAGGVAGICSLVTQAGGSWARNTVRQPLVPAGIPAAYPGGPFPPGYQRVSPDDTVQQLGPRLSAAAMPATLATPLPIDPNAPIERWAGTRMFWGLVSFALMVLFIVTLLVPHILNDMTSEDTTGTIIGCIACGAALTFALRKTAPLRKPGFGRNIVLPGMLTLGLFGAGAITTGMIRHWVEFNNDSRILSVVGLCASAIFLFVGFFPPRVGRVVARPFLVGGGHPPATVGMAASYGDQAARTPAHAEAGKSE